MPHAIARLTLTASLIKGAKLEKTILERFLESISGKFCQIIEDSNFQDALPTGEGENSEIEGKVTLASEIEFYNFGPETSEGEQSLKKSIEKILPEWVERIEEKIAEAPETITAMSVIEDITVQLELVDVSAEDIGFGAEGSED